MSELIPQSVDNRGISAFDTSFNQHVFISHENFKKFLRQVDYKINYKAYVDRIDKDRSVQLQLSTMYQYHRPTGVLLAQPIDTPSALSPL